MSSQGAEVLAGEARGLASAARKFEARGEYEEARSNYLAASEKFLQSAFNSPPELKKLRLDLSKFFLAKARELKEDTERRHRVESVEKPAPLDLRKVVVAEKPDVKFDQIGGLEDVKETMRMEVIYPYTKEGRSLYEIYGREAGGGALLYGPPGCGKTLLAKAIAAECGLTFIAPKVSDIMDMYVGESEKRVNEIFEYARSCGKAVIFLDELDSLVPRSGPLYSQRIKNEILQQIDGIYSKKENLLILGATNKPWRLDTALRRPGRLGKMIFIPPPDFEARKAIFKIHLQKVISKGMLAEDVNFDELASKTEGFSGADIEQVCKDAVDIPLREALKGANPRKVTTNDFSEILAKSRPSIIPWFEEAIRSVRRAGEEEAFVDMMKSGEDFLAKYGKKA